VPIVPSRAGRIQELLERLSSPSAAERDSAVAGLTLLGSRVIEPLSTFLDEASASARLAALELLEALDDRRVLPLVVGLAASKDEAVAARALALAGERPDPRGVRPLTTLMADGRTADLRRLAALALVRFQAAGVLEALEPLVGCVLDESREPALRLAVLDGLATMDPPLGTATLRPLLDKLAASATPLLSARAAALRRPARKRHRGDAAPGEGLARALRGTGGVASIPLLLEELERLGEARTTRSDPLASVTRAEVHRALAHLDSRVALHDLREAIETRPCSGMQDLLEAAARVGDARILPALARAAAEDAGLAQPCAAAFTAIVRREHPRRTRSLLKAVHPAHRASFDALWERANLSGRSRRR
jgi:hypothetical protein